MNKKLIIFDCDGVLVDSEFVSSRIFAKTLSAYGYSLTTEECVRKFTGINEHVCRDLIREETGIELPSNYWSLAFPALQEAFKRELTPLMQPVLQLLDEQQMERCVASNSSKEHVLHCLEFTKQLKYFDEHSIFTASQVKKAKPAPDLFLFAAEKMGFHPEECLVIEDSLIGAKAATQAGMEVLMFLGGTHAQDKAYRTQIATCNQPIVQDVHELVNILQDMLQMTYQD